MVAGRKVALQETHNLHYSARAMRLGSILKLFVTALAAVPTYGQTISKNTDTSGPVNIVGDILVNRGVWWSIDNWINPVFQVPVNIQGLWYIYLNVPGTR